MVAPLTKNIQTIYITEKLFQEVLIPIRQAAHL